MTTCRASSSYGRLPRYRKRRWIFLYPRLWVPPTKITRSWIISVSAFLGNFRALMRVALYTSSDKCCLQACWGDEVYSEWGGEFFCTGWKFVATFKRGFWTIEIEKLRKSRFSKGFLGMVDSRKFVTRIIELRTMHPRRDLESNGKRWINFFAKNLHIAWFLYQFVFRLFPFILTRGRWCYVDLWKVVFNVRIHFR